jgi:hypothetical protein
MNWKKASWSLLPIAAAFALAAGAAAQTMIEAIPRSERPPAPAVAAPSFGGDGGAQDAVSGQPGSRNENIVTVPDSEMSPEDARPPATDDSDGSNPQAPEGQNSDQ